MLAQQQKASTRDQQYHAKELLGATGSCVLQQSDGVRPYMVEIRSDYVVCLQKRLRDSHFRRLDLAQLT